MCLSCGRAEGRAAREREKEHEKEREKEHARALMTGPLSWRAGGSGEDAVSVDGAVSSLPQQQQQQGGGGKLGQFDALDGDASSTPSAATHVQHGQGKGGGHGSL